MSPVYVSDSGGSSFNPHPAGQYAARCVDVVDVGWVKTQYGPKYRVRLVFFGGETEEKETDEGKKTFPLLVFSTFSATLSERGNLRPFLESWRGQPFTEDELKKFDLEKLLHAPAFLQIVHNKSPDGTRTYANVKTIMKLPKGMKAPEAPEGFIRACERDDWTGPATHPDQHSVDPEEREPQDTTDYGSGTDDDLPF